MQVQISRIKVRNGHNFRKKFDIDDLKKSMDERGQLQPILISSDLSLVAGERRLRAARELGWGDIECKIQSYPNEESQIADGIFENLKRESYTKSEEAEALAWLKEHRKDMNEVAAPGGDRRSVRSKRTGDHLKTHAKRVSEATGVSERTVNKRTRIGERMSNGLADALDDEVVGLKQAEQIVRLDKKFQDRVITKVAGKTLDETKAIVDEFLERSEDRGPKEYKPKASLADIDGERADVWLRCLYKELGAVAHTLQKAFQMRAWEKSETEGPKFAMYVSTFAMVWESLKKKPMTMKLIREGTSDGERKQNAPCVS